MTEKPQAEVTERMVRGWLVHDRAAAEATKGARLNLLEESKLLIGLVQEIEAQAKREGAREALELAAQEIEFREAHYVNPVGSHARAIRALAAEPEVKERKTIVHQGPLQEDGTWHSEPEVKPCSCECHERTPKACESCRERHESAPSKAGELPLEHEFFPGDDLNVCCHQGYKRDFLICGLPAAVHRRS